MAADDVMAWSSLEELGSSVILTLIACCTTSAHGLPLVGKLTVINVNFLINQLQIRPFLAAATLDRWQDGFLSDK